MKLRTILVDDEPWCMEQFEMECTDTNIELLGKFESAKEALGYVGEHGVDLAFLDVEMPEMSGIILGKKLRKIRPDIIVIYISGYEKYLSDAILDVKADYYLLKTIQSSGYCGCTRQSKAFIGQAEEACVGAYIRRV